jgi:hypothetical protein
MINIVLTRIDANGVPSGTYSGHAETVNRNCEGWATVQGPPEGDWWDSELSQWKVKPAQPDEYHVFDYTTKQWYDPRTLNDIKLAKWAIIKQARSSAEFGGFTWDGSPFDSDAISQSRIQGAVQLAATAPGFTIDWTLANNSVRNLSAADLANVGAALGMHVATQHAKARTLRSQIEAATTPAEVDAVVW